MLSRFDWVWFFMGVVSSGLPAGFEPEFVPSVEYVEAWSGLVVGLGSWVDAESVVKEIFGTS